MTGAHFGLMHAQVYGCSVLGHGSPGLLGTTKDLRYVNLQTSFIHKIGRNGLHIYICSLCSKHV